MKAPKRLMALFEEYSTEAKKLQTGGKPVCLIVVRSDYAERQYKMFPLAYTQSSEEKFDFHKRLRPFLKSITVDGAK